MFDDDFEPISKTTATVYELCQSLSCVRGAGNNFTLGVKDMKGFENTLNKLGTKIQNPQEYDVNNLKKDEILLFNYSLSRNRKENGPFLVVFLNDKGYPCHMGMNPDKWTRPKPSLWSLISNYVHKASPLYVANGKDEIIKAIQQYWTEMVPPKYKK